MEENKARGINEKGERERERKTNLD